MNKLPQECMWSLLLGKLHACAAAHSVSRPKTLSSSFMFKTNPYLCYYSFTSLCFVLNFFLTWAVVPFPLFDCSFIVSFSVSGLWAFCCFVRFLLGSPYLLGLHFMPGLVICYICLVKLCLSWHHRCLNVQKGLPQCCLFVFLPHIRRNFF